MKSLINNQIKSKRKVGKSSVRRSNNQTNLCPTLPVLPSILNQRNIISRQLIRNASNINKEESNNW